MKKRLRKRFIITTVSAASIGLLIVIGAISGSSKPAQEISEVEPQKVERKRGKYAAENSEKVRFFAAQQIKTV